MQVLGIGSNDLESNQLLVTVDFSLLFGVRWTPRNFYEGQQWWLHLGPLTVWYRQETTRDAIEQAAETQMVLDALRCPECLCTREVTPEGLWCEECNTMYDPPDGVVDEEDE